MAEGLVDDLEAVEVEQQHRQVAAEALGTALGVARTLHEQGAIGQACQGVVVGQLVELPAHAVGGHACAEHVADHLQGVELDARPLALFIGIVEANKAPQGVIHLDRHYRQRQDALG